MPHFIFYHLQIHYGLVQPKKLSFFFAKSLLASSSLSSSLSSSSPMDDTYIPQIPPATSVLMHSILLGKKLFFYYKCQNKDGRQLRVCNCVYGKSMRQNSIKYIVVPAYARIFQMIANIFENKNIHTLHQSRTFDRIYTPMCVFLRIRCIYIHIYNTL